MPSQSNKQLEAAEKVLRSMTDAQRVKFIGNNYIKFMEQFKQLAPGTLPPEEQQFWRENAKWLVEWGGGNREPRIVLYDAYKTIQLHISSTRGIINPISIIPFAQFLNYVVVTKDAVEQGATFAVSTTKQIIAGGAEYTMKGATYAVEGAKSALGLVASGTKDAVTGGTEFIANKIGDGIQVIGDKIHQGIVSVFGTAQDIAYVSIAVGMVGTTVIYLRRRERD